MENAKWICTYLGKYKKWMIIGFFSLLIMSAVNILKIYYIKILIDNIGHQESLLINILFLLVIIIFGSAASYLMTSSAGKLAAKIASNIKKEVSGHLIELPISYIENKYSGDIFSRLNNDVNDIYSFLADNLINLIFQPIMIVCALLIMLKINLLLLLISSAFIVLSFCVTNIFAKRMVKYSKDYQEFLGKGLSIIKQVINGINVVKSFNIEEIITSSVSKEFEKSLKAGINIEKSNSLTLPSFIMMKHFPRLICVIIGGYMAINGEIGIGGLVAFLQLLDFLIQPAITLPGMITNAGRALSATERLMEILRNRKEREDGTDFAYLTDNNEIISFENISFRYNPSQLILDNMSFAINKGSVTALVGLSGSGKTTIFNLLVGFYDEYCGLIKLCGRDISDWNLIALRSQIAYVPQTSCLFSGSIKDNIGCSDINASFDEIVQAAKLANAHEFIMNLPEKYDTLIGERGAKLSGGQIQRISIARAILKKSPVIVMDEPTSALDTLSESLIQQTIEKLKGKRTILIVAHRYSIIKNADCILVLDLGKIVEKGTHDNLVKRNGFYNQLYKRQAI